MISETLAFLILLGFFQSFLILFIPAFFLVFFYLIKKKVTYIIALLGSFVLGTIIALMGYSYVLDIIVSLETIGEYVPEVILNSIVILEIIAVIIHIRTWKKKSR